MIKDIEDWRKAGEILESVFKNIRSNIKAGKKIIDLCLQIEKKIIDMGAKPAFPANISVNNVAAHYTSPPADLTTLPSNALVKVDIGVLVNGAIADAAYTFIINGNKYLHRLVKANMEVLDSVVEIIKDGIKLSQISRFIWEKSHEAGFGVLVDLGGHEIKKHVLHAGMFIPNSPKVLRRDRKIKEGMIIAIEPFLVSSANDSYSIHVHDRVYIFSIKQKLVAKKDRFLASIYKNFRTLPFALRWLISSHYGSHKYVSILEKKLMYLMSKGLINGYPVLVDAKGNWVSQFEYTVLVKKSSAEVLTKIKL